MHKYECTEYVISATKITFVLLVSILWFLCSYWSCVISTECPSCWFKWFRWTPRKCDMPTPYIFVVFCV